MHAGPGSVEERREVESILGSGIFARAPNLAQLLAYVCEKYFEGSAGQIKEYNIAVDALGRPADFDQKRDSIVRVEAHRLRKRLRDYYAAEGADHPVHIDIPPGQYAPRFLVRIPPVVNGKPEIAAELPDVQTMPPPEPAKGPTSGRRRIAILVPLCLLIVSAAVVVPWRAVMSKPAVPAGSKALPVYSSSVSDPRAVRILAGYSGPGYTDRFGRIWQSDRWFQGGAVFQAGNHPILGARDPRLFRSRREGSFSYDVPLPAGSYELRLYFAETLYGEDNPAGGGETSRLFDVFLNGKELLRDFDVIGEAGPSAAHIRAFRDISPSSDGRLHLRFEAKANPPFLNAIEITPGEAGRMLPIRMVSQTHAYTDKQGRTWAPDLYARGGQLVLRAEPVTNTGDPELYRGERYGNIQFVVPVAPGRYAATFHFAETWFGPGSDAGGGIGSRLFDIFCNGAALRRNYDIYKEARGSGRAVSFTSRGLEPDAQGRLTISLIPVRNYAAINAIEVVEESK